MKILTSESPTLRQASTEVLFPLDNATSVLAKTMLDYVREDEGSAGLAAPQVGVNTRMVVVSDSKRNPKLLINPRITLASGEIKPFPEGCLSIPGKLYLVPRSTTIKYNYQDISGKVHQAKAKGWEARVILHEVDHLSGVLIDTKGELITKKDAQQYYD